HKKTLQRKKKAPVPKRSHSAAAWRAAKSGSVNWTLRMWGGKNPPPQYSDLNWAGWAKQGKRARVPACRQGRGRTARRLARLYQPGRATGHGPSRGFTSFGGIGSICLTPPEL